MKKLPGVLFLSVFLGLFSLARPQSQPRADVCDTRYYAGFFRACGYDADETDPSDTNLWTYRDAYNERSPTTVNGKTTALSYQFDDCEDGIEDGHGYGCNYGKIWRGNIYFEAGAYEFHTQSDDGVKLFVDETQIISDWEVQSPEDNYYTLYLDEGYHTVRLEYFQGSGWHYAVLDWTKKTCDESYKTDGFHVCGYVAETPDERSTWNYKSDYDENSPSTLGNTTTAFAYELADGEDDGHGFTNNYGKEWRGRINFSESGNYIFHAKTDDGFRLFLDGTNILESWEYQSPTDYSTDPINVNAGYHDVRLEYFQSTGGHTIQLDWTYVPCPYTSLQPRFRVKINGVWQDWTDDLNINQWQKGDLQTAVFYDDTSDFASLDYVQAILSGTTLTENPADIGGLIPGVGNYGLGANGLSSCPNLETVTASLNVLYCPYKNIAINSNRGRSGDPWVSDLTINKKDSKAGTVSSGVYFDNDDGSGNQWAQINNLSFALTKPSNEELAFDTNYKDFPAPPSWYSPGLYLNYPGHYDLAATATNDGASCGDYPPVSKGTIEMINCSYDTTVAGFQEIALPAHTWVDNLFVPYAGTTVRSSGFHDRTLTSIPADVSDIKTYTPAEQVILEVVGPGGYDQRSDQGAPFTYTGLGQYTLTVRTPDLDTADTEDVEDGAGCFATANLNVGAEAPVTACVETGNKINCCPFTLSGESLWSGLVDVLDDAVGWIITTYGEDNNIAPFKMGVSVDRIEFTADRTAHANLLFGRVRNESGLEKLERGSVFWLAPPGALSEQGLETDPANDFVNIDKRREKVSWEVGLESDSQPLKKGSLGDVGPTALAAEQLQKYLTRLPGVGDTLVAANFKNQLSQRLPQTSVQSILENASERRSFSIETSFASAQPSSPADQILGIDTSNSCQDKLPRTASEVECYETSATGPDTQLSLSTLLWILQTSDSLTSKVSDIDVAARSLVGEVTVCDTDGRGCTETKISQNAGVFDLFKTPGGAYQNIAADGKTSPIRFTTEIGTPAGSPISPIMTFLSLFYGIPYSGSGIVPASRFNPLFRDCSVVYTGQGTYPDIGAPKLSCVYLISSPELKMRYFGSIQSALYNTDLSAGEPGVACKTDIPGGQICQAQAVGQPIITPPPGFTSNCTLCNFNQGAPSLKTLLEEVAGNVGTPASVLAGMLNFEGIEPTNPVGHIFNNDEATIIDISTPGNVDPYCATSPSGDQGPCQLSPGSWSTYGGTVNNYDYTHTPNICNLRDCLYAAAAKLKNDAAYVGSACGYQNTAAPGANCQWSGENTAKGAYHYYGACTENYVTTVVNYFYNYSCQP